MLRLSRYVALAFLPCLTGITCPALAASSTAAAESLLSAPEDASWSLESIPPVHASAAAAPALPHSGAARPPTALRQDVTHTVEPSSAALRRQVKHLQAQVNFEQKAEAGLRDDLIRSQEALAAAKTAVPVPDSATENPLTDVQRNQVSTLKAVLADRETRLRELTAPQESLRRTLSERESALAKAGREIADLRATLAQKMAAQAETAAARTTQTVPGNWPESIQDTSVLAKQTADLNALKNVLVQKDRAVQDLNATLAARGDELKAAATALADLRQKQSAGSAAPANEAQRQAYMAGVMMAEGLTGRLEGWEQAGVAVNRDLFRAGLTDALADKVRLKPVEARKAQAAFVQAVQQGAAHRVAEAQKQLTALAKGRKPLKSVAGITWYRVHRGKPVTHGQPVRLAMTEQVAGGNVVSRVPPVLLRPGDDMPSVVKDGMYLPGEGGEVVAYGLARQVYGDLPLPQGVQPFTVMEYHLLGVAGMSEADNR